jgi:hypothetical protein
MATDIETEVEVRATGFGVKALSKSGVIVHLDSNSKDPKKLKITVPLGDARQIKELGWGDFDDPDAAAPPPAVGNEPPAGNVPAQHAGEGSPPVTIDQSGKPAVAGEGKLQADQPLTAQQKATAAARAARERKAAEKKDREAAAAAAKPDPVQKQAAPPKGDKAKPEMKEDEGVGDNPDSAPGA